jgi:hypothetical protein
MLISTPSQWAILALVLIAGWFFGLASHSGGRKWKDRYAAERDAHAAHRKDVDARVTDSDRRVAELQRENARLASAAPVAGVAATRSSTSVRPAASARPAYPAGERRGWFDWGTRP